MYRRDKRLIDFFLNERMREKKAERALNKLELSDCIFKAYTAAQPTEKGKTNKAFTEFKKYREELLKDIFDDYEEIKKKQIEEEGRKTWADLKTKKRIKL
jgi:hypothetical protein